jgi:N-acetylglucosamine-6-phosphate deacetylase
MTGYLDMHCHGAVGFDFGSCSLGEARQAVDYHKSRGTDTLIASVATAPIRVLTERVQLLGGLEADGKIAGIHLEGPYLSPGHKGAHAPELLRHPAIAELQVILAAHPGAVKMVTIAPELPGAEAAIKYLVDQGVVVAVGHTSCTGAQARAAFDWGATVLTHGFNGMPGLHHREPGPLGVAMLDDRVTVELILDGHHVCNEAAQILLQVAGDRVALISDAMAATGLGDGDYEIAGSPVLVKDSIARVTTTGALAGSTITVSDGVDRMINVLGIPKATAIAAATSTPAKALGITIND